LGLAYSQGYRKSCAGTSFCVYAGPEGNNIVFTVHSAYPGWASVGVGIEMADSAMYVGWKVDNSFTVISTTASKLIFTKGAIFALFQSPLKIFNWFL
jgi:hypothetical protein